MQTSDLIKIKNITLISKNIKLDKEIKGFYCSDLLSFVLGHVKEDGVVLLTVLNTINAVAVATIIDMPAIIFCDGVIPDSSIVEKAEEENIAIFASSNSSAKVAVEINALLL